jgi:S-adenosylmethionine:tRNA ribosyltransferase-isomerase
VSQSQPYSYILPSEKIAQRPLHPQENAKMLVINTDKGTLRDSYFHALPEYINSQYLIVFNNSLVIKARIFCEIVGETGRFEMLLIENREHNKRIVWRCIGRPMKKFQEGKTVHIADDLKGVVLSNDGTYFDVQFYDSAFPLTDFDRWMKLLSTYGTMPIPPYIRKGESDDEDATDYQSIFAQEPGSIAAPTASLHFSEKLLLSLEACGIQKRFLTLHVGIPSFKPVVKDEKNDTLMLPGDERYSMRTNVFREIKKFKDKGGKILAVGTTAARCLETVALQEAVGVLDESRYQQDTIEGRTDLFITPGFQFRIVDALITNFHQPGTSHLLLVEAFLGRALLEQSYIYSLSHNYRFLSYGDGMLIVTEDIRP